VYLKVLQSFFALEQVQQRTNKLCGPLSLEGNARVHGNRYFLKYVSFRKKNKTFFRTNFGQSVGGRLHAIFSPLVGEQ